MQTSGLDGSLHLAAIQDLTPCFTYRVNKGLFPTYFQNKGEKTINNLWYFKG